MTSFPQRWFKIALFNLKAGFNQFNDSLIRDSWYRNGKLISRREADILLRKETEDIKNTTAKVKLA